MADTHPHPNAGEATEEDAATVRDTYRTRGGILVRRRTTTMDPDEMSRRFADLTAELDHRRGGVLSSGVEYPGRYSRWHLGYADPPLALQTYGRRLRVDALNQRGAVLLPAVAGALEPTGQLTHPAEHETHGTVWLDVPEDDAAAGTFTEEERTRRASVFDALRALVRLFGAPDDRHLGLYGAFGYDLGFQLEPVRLHHDRPPHQRDLVLHLPDRILAIDRKREVAHELEYDFEVDGRRTDALARTGIPSSLRYSGFPENRRPRAYGHPRARGAGTGGSRRTGERLPGDRDRDAGLPEPEPGRFAEVVRAALPYFRRGDLFEVTPSHVLTERCDSPAEFFGRLRVANPAPYELLFNLGEGEHLVAASPEMFVRVNGDRVETCPIAGTIARGADALGDAAQIRTLLTSAKDEAELTMCTDVDRNDKARVCQPGSVRVIGRRQIELYSRLIHTVDHIEGRLRPGMDALDAFLTHTWAVTVTGAPKHRAMQFIEDHEDSPREWYAAAAGFLGFDGSMNTGLTLRAASIRDGVARIRAGATLLADSDPDAEEAESLLKARALREVLRGERGAPEDPAGTAPDAPAGAEPAPGDGLRVLLVDHQDSFVLTLADYFRQLGCAVHTLRYGFDEARLDEFAPDLVVLSPGPGEPGDFDCSALLDALDRRDLPAFGVCLGLQAMVEHRGGRLSLLPEPAHGKASSVRPLELSEGSGASDPSDSSESSALLRGLDAPFVGGRYHSVYADPADVVGFRVTATGGSADPAAAGEPGIAMAIEDPERRRWAVQFHPESIMTANDRAGHRLLANLLTEVRASRRTSRTGVR